MQYEFITHLKEVEYNKLTENCNYIHYQSDSTWCKLHKVNDVYYLGLKKKNKFLGCAKAEVINVVGNNLLNISNISLFTKNEIIISLFLNEIIRFAKEMKVYKIKILSIEQKLNIKRKKIQQYSVLSLYNKNKFYRKDYFKKLFNADSTNFISFETKITNKSINELKKTIDNWNINLDINLEELISTYKSKCSIILEKIDLVYYLNKIEENHNSKLNSDTIEELISEYGEEMIVGFAIILFPTNKSTAYCTSFKTIDSFDELYLQDSLMLETINACLKKKYKQIIFKDKFNNINSINEYQYEIILNKFKNLILKLQKKED